MDEYCEDGEIDNLLETIESEDDSDDSEVDEVDDTLEVEENEPTTSEATERPTFEWKSDLFDPRAFSFDDTESGCKADSLASDAIEMDYFKCFIHISFIEMIVRETNKQFKFATKNITVLSDRLRRWVDCTTDDIYTFLGVCMLMSRNSRNKITEHWSIKRPLFSPYYSESMSRNRFELLHRMLHFSDNETQIPGDRLYKIRQVLQELKISFKQYLYPYQNLCIDESLLLFKGRLLFRQFIRTKASRFGIKIFVMADCKTGFVLDIIIYTGKQTEIQKKNYIGISGNVVVTLLEPYLERGHTLFIDNWYSSPTLFKYLYDHRTNACGTVRRNRIGMPKFVKKLKRGETEAFHTDEMMALAWKDKKDVTMLTTVHKNVFKPTGKVNYVTKIPISKPESIVDYNKNMGAVDQSDMMLSSVNSSRKTLKWYKKLFFHLLDLSLLNAHILYQQKTGNKQPLGDFQLNVIDQLIQKHKTQPKTNLKRKVPLPTRLTERHFLGKIPPTDKKNSATKRCYVCYNTKNNKKRRETRFVCKQCDIALCFEPCFEIYHTEENF
jgi:hypothetical protein